MKNFFKDAFNFENFKAGSLMSTLSNNPDAFIISYLKSKMNQSNDVNKNLDNKKAA